MWRGPRARLTHRATLELEDRLLPNATATAGVDGQSVLLASASAATAATTAAADATALALGGIFLGRPVAPRLALGF